MKYDHNLLGYNTCQQLKLLDAINISKRMFNCPPIISKFPQNMQSKKNVNNCLNQISASGNFQIHTIEQLGQK